jgi:hypothetical protein
MIEIPFAILIEISPGDPSSYTPTARYPSCPAIEKWWVMVGRSFGRPARRPDEPQALSSHLVRTDADATAVLSGGVAWFSLTVMTCFTRGLHRSRRCSHAVATKDLRPQFVIGGATGPLLW